jgi:hypothetical protein
MSVDALEAVSVIAMSATVAMAVAALTTDHALLLDRHSAAPRPAGPCSRHTASRVENSEKPCVVWAMKCSSSLPARPCAPNVIGLPTHTHVHGLTTVPGFAVRSATCTSTS